MKKLLFLSLSVLAIAAVVTVKSINTKSGMSSLMTQNIEALTQGESGGNSDCWDTITAADAQYTRYCGTCTVIAGKPSLFSFMKKC